MSSHKLSTINRQLLAICSLMRYRFFLFAGIFPYLLGQAIAFNSKKGLNWHYFGLGFLGIIFVLIGVELFNEYFDAQEGGDRIFAKSQEQRAYGKEHRAKGIEKNFLLALCSMLLAFIIGLYLTFQTGWPVLLFSFLGFLGAYFYVGPPLRWAYRGLGELVIALSYGPCMVLGSYYLQTRRIDFIPFFASLLCALSLFSLALLNEIPDYYQDRLVGKRNLVVRLGKEKSLKLLSSALICLFVLLAIGVVLKKIPLLAVISFCFLPWLIRSLAKARQDFDKPKEFFAAVNACVIIYLAIAVLLSFGYWIG